MDSTKTEVNSDQKSVRAPSRRQIIAAQHLVEKGGSVADAMRAAGYSENTIKTPSKLTATASFQSLMVSQGITPERLAEVLKEGLEAADEIEIEDKQTGEKVVVGRKPDYKTRHKYLETALKLSGLGTEAPPPNQTNNFFVLREKQKDEYGL